MAYPQKILSKIGTSIAIDIIHFFFMISCDIYLKREKHVKKDFFKIFEDNFQSSKQTIN